jgi:WD40 repeat protein
MYRLLTGADDGIIFIWNVNTGACLDAMTGHARAITAMAALTSEYVISASADGHLKVCSFHCSLSLCLSHRQCFALTLAPHAYICCLHFDAPPVP